MIFPVKVPYTVSADITKYQGPVFNSSPSTKYILQKKIELDDFASSICNTAIGAEDLVKRLSIFCGFSATENIKEVALQLEEDIAIIHDGILKSICFCFPSGFVPANKIGMSFFDMHLPVADGDKLRGASNKVTELISKEGASFRRYVWTVSSLSSLSQHPLYERPVPNSVDDLYFRTEIQTTIGIPDNICFFFVKVDMIPLRIIWGDENKKNALMESMNSMSEEVLKYKNLTDIKSLLNNLMD